jgi:hypothetical protein
LKDYSGWFEWNVHFFFLVLHPVQDVLDIMRLNIELIAVPDCRFEKDPDRIWKGVCSQKQE